jgi:hypothetical protein
MYQQWQLPAKKIAALVADDRLVLVSHKPPAGGWAAVASGSEDAMITALADTYRSFGREVLFSFHHEPHDDASDVKGGTAGTAAEYKAAWRRIRTIFDARGASHSVGGDVFFAYSAVGSWALTAARGGPPGSGDPLYPGDDVIDVFAHDAYNWASCHNVGWQEFSVEWAPLVALAAAHHKPLLAAEFGSPPAGGERNDWFRHAATWLETDPLARQWMWGFAYFHSLHDTCPWDFLNQADDGRLGWQDAFRTPYFTGTPFSLASTAPSPGPTDPTTTTTSPPHTPIIKAAAPPNPAAPTHPATATTTATTATRTTTTTTTPATNRVAPGGHSPGETPPPTGAAPTGAGPPPSPAPGSPAVATPAPVRARPAQPAVSSSTFLLAALLAAIGLLVRRITS